MRLQFTKTEQDTQGRHLHIDWMFTQTLEISAVHGFQAGGRREAQARKSVAARHGVKEKNPRG